MRLNPWLIQIGTLVRTPLCPYFPIHIIFGPSDSDENSKNLLYYRAFFATVVECLHLAFIQRIRRCIPEKQIEEP
jgi:hypothetical protein